MSDDNEAVGTIINQIILTRFAVASLDLLVLFEFKCRIAYDETIPFSTCGYR